MKCIEVVLDNELYSKRAVLEAKAAFLEYADFKIVPQTSSSVKLIITMRSAYIQDYRQIFCEFINYILDRSVQILMERG